MVTNQVLFAGLVLVGELAVGIALILGLLTPLAAVVGFFMNLNFWLAFNEVHLRASRDDTLGPAAQGEARHTPEHPLPALTEEERSRLLGYYNCGTFEDVRNRAFVAVLLATELRFREVLEAPLDHFDRISGVLTIRAKGNRDRSGRLSSAALKYVREYLRVRPTSSPGNRLWLQANGEPLSYWGGQTVIRRLKERSGVARIHAHLCRHTFTQVALRKGAERRLVQDMLGHRTDVIARRYAGTMREETAAECMSQHSPI